MKAQLSREELKQKLIECSQNASGMLEVGEDTMCAMMALIEVMDSEPVAYSLRFRNMSGVLNEHINTNTTFDDRETAEAYGKGGSYIMCSDGSMDWVSDTSLDAEVVPLYAAPPAQMTYPETLPCPVSLEPGIRFGKNVTTRLMLEALQRRADYYAELEAMTPEQGAEHDAGIAEFRAMLPASVAVPDVIGIIERHAERLEKDGRAAEGFAEDQRKRYAAAMLRGVANACRAAMLQNGTLINEGTMQAEPWIKCSERMPKNSDEVLCAVEFDGPGDWRKKVGYWLAGKWVVYGASWKPTHWMPLPAAPEQEV